MTPIRTLWISLAVGVAFCLPSHAQQEKPNLLFIFADDQCFSTIHSLGNQEIETPNLDRLAGQSTVFTHAYNMGSWSGAVCVASRTMLNTGRFVWRAEKDYKETQERYADKGLMWSQLLEKAGYDTYFTGKWHVRANPETVFTVSRNVRGGMPNQTPEGYNRPIEGQEDVWSPYDPKFEGFWKGGKHWSEVVGDDGVDFLTQAKGSENPFFMYLAFNAPHDPRQSPKEFVDKYPWEEIELPENYMPLYPYREEMRVGKGQRDESLAPFPRTEYAVKVNRQEYYAIITHMDQQIGRILDELEASGQAENTYIFFSADHGLACGEHGLMGKQNMFEHSLRVPLMVSGPGIEKDKHIDARVYLQDIMATTLELAETERPEHVEFQSLMPLVRGEKEQQYDAIYGGYLDAQRAVLVGDYKLILYPRVPVALLFNVEEDPLEMTNLAENPENLPLVKKMFSKLLELQEELEDDLDLKAAYPELL